MTQKELVQSVTLGFDSTPTESQQYCLNLLGNDPEAQKLLLYITCFPQSTWDDLFNSLPDSQADQLGQRLHSLAVNAAAMGTYFEQRGNSGCSHDTAMEKHAATKKKVRTALGLTYI